LWTKTRPKAFLKDPHAKRAGEFFNLSKQKPTRNNDGVAKRALSLESIIYLNWGWYRVPGVTDANRSLQQPHHVLGDCKELVVLRIR
jgi:hypothetical protein